MPNLIGSSTAPHDYLYWEHHRFDRKTSALRQDSMWQAARMGDWKGVRPKPGDPTELYNLAEDIGESNNLAAAQPDVLARIESSMAEAHSEPRPQVGGVFEYAT
ncbi:MAG: hypothetical protein GY953_30935 [bacterium]|nr:hypothetical protein [bacterium]